jgi:hypothetical protein
MGGAFTGNVYIFYACRFRLCFNDLSDVGTVWYFVSLESQNSYDGPWLQISVLYLSHD